MDAAPAVGPVLLLATLVAVALMFPGWHDWLVARRRGRVYAHYCVQRGFLFERRRPGEERRHATTCARVFAEGRGQRWGFTITGTYRASLFTAFEYTWIIGEGRSSMYHKIGGILWPVEPDLAQFMLTPKGFWSKMEEDWQCYWSPSAQDIAFDDSPEFTRAYRLQGSDEVAVRALFTPDLRHTFALQPPQGVAAGPQEVLWWRKGGLPSPDVLDEFLMDGNRILLLLQRPIDWGSRRTGRPS